METLLGILLVLLVLVMLVDMIYTFIGTVKANKEFKRLNELMKEQLMAELDKLEIEIKKEKEYE